MDEFKARRVVDTLRERGTEAHLARVGVYQFGVRVALRVSQKRMFALLGVHGQAIFVDPESKVVIVHTAVHAESRGTTSRYDQFSLFFGTAARAAALNH